jgi:hypothetical protein
MGAAASGIAAARRLQIVPVVVVIKAVESPTGPVAEAAHLPQPSVPAHALTAHCGSREWSEAKE